MSATMLISELAQRSGFTPSTLRYYEQVGLLRADSRSPAGYRLYDEKVTGKLRLIARAKQLGLPLEEIRDLVVVWDGGLCAHVQERLRAQISAKSVETQARIQELSSLAGELAAARVELARQAPDGACRDGCGCTTEAGDRSPGEAGDRSPDGLGSEPSVACTLGPAEQPARLAEWQDVLSSLTGRETVPGGVCLSFPSDPALASRLADLAVREQACCAFFDFTLRIGQGCVALEVRAPDAAEVFVTGLFGGSF